MWVWLHGASTHVYLHQPTRSYRAGAREWNGVGHTTDNAQKVQKSGMDFFRSKLSKINLWGVEQVYCTTVRLCCFIHMHLFFHSLAPALHPRGLSFFAPYTLALHLFSPSFGMKWCGGPSFILFFTSKLVHLVLFYIFDVQPRVHRSGMGFFTPWHLHTISFRREP